MWKRIAVAFLFAAVVTLGAVFAYLVLRKPAMQPPSTRVVPRTPERVERGRYLFMSVANCAECHSEVDWTRFATPIRKDGIGAGKIWPPEAGLPGSLISPNITPDAGTGVGGWPDGEVMRAIREGIGRDGRVLFPLMPYTEFRSMSDEDVESIVAFIRTLAPIQRKMEPSRIDFPVGLLVKGAPQPVTGVVEAPNRADRAAYGRYLSVIAGCRTCHTPTRRGSQVEGMQYAGGESFGTEKSGLLAVSFNLTPDKGTGTGTWDEKQFLEKFRQYREYAQGTPPPATKENFTVMPWLSFNGMEDDDLKALFAFLQTLKPVEHSVETRPLAEKK